MRNSFSENLPGGWIWVTIGEVVDPFIEQAGPQSDKAFLYVDIGSIDNKAKKITNPKTLSISETPSRAKQNLLPNDVLVSLTRPNLNAVAIVPTEMTDAVGSTGFQVLRTRWVNPYWLFYIVQTEAFVDEMTDLVQGALYPAIKSVDVLSYQIPLAPFAEQQRVVDEIEKQFAAIDATIANLKEMEANLKKLREETLTAACEGRLVANESDLAFEQEREYESGEELLERILKERLKKWEADQLARMKAQGKEPKDDKWKSKYQEPAAPDTTSLPELPEGWIWVTLEQCCSKITDGTHQPPKFTGKGIPFIFVGNIVSGSISFQNTQFISEETYQRLDARCPVEEGDILYSVVGSYGVAVPVLVQKNFSFQRHIAHLKLVLPESQMYTVYCLNSDFGRNQAHKKARGVAQKTITLGALRQFVIPLPPLAEQQRIVDEVEEQFSFFDENEKNVQENLKRTEGLRQTVLQQAFAGKLVPQNPNDEPTSALLERIKAERLEGEILEIKKPKRKREKKTDSSKVSNIEAKFPFEINELKPMSSLKESEIQSMRLITLKLDEDYKSLHELNQIFRYDGVARDSISPICLVGLNGSGKSNLIESLSEIFCYLELINLPYESIKSGHKKTALRFEMEYELPLKGADQVRRIRIKKHDSASPTFLEVNGEKEKEVVGEKNQLDILPTRIIGYSSGLNETISIPFFKTKALYSKDVGERAKKDSAQKNIPVEDSKTLFMDYESNAAILLANYLFKTKESLDLFREHLRIDDIASFEITIQLKRPGKQRVLLTPELEESIARLKKCASGTTFERGGNKVTFTYEVSLQVLNAFRETFINSKNFFKTIYKLSLLNALALDKREREFYLREGTKQGLLEKPPTVSKEDRIFSINRLRLKLTEPEKEIDYAGISDGEHQFIHVFGTVKLFDEPGVIFLLDEPETHFNPRWRREFVQILDNIPSTKNQEFVISTHSPFIVSGCRKENVFHFERKDGIVNCQPVDFETYGASFEFLLTKLFKLESLISETALEDLKEVIKSDDLKTLEAAVNQFGESYEKRFLFEKIVKRKKEENNALCFLNWNMLKITRSIKCKKLLKHSSIIVQLKRDIVEIASLNGSEMCFNIHQN